MLVMTNAYCMVLEDQIKTKKEKKDKLWRARSRLYGQLRSIFRDLQDCQHGIPIFANCIKLSMLLNRFCFNDYIFLISVKLQGSKMSFFRPNQMIKN